VALGATAYLLVAHGTIEEDLCRILQRKSMILDKVLDGASHTANTLNIFSELQQILIGRNHE